MAERLRPHMAGLIDKDQAGFVPGRETRDNILRGHLLIQKAKQSKTPVMFMSLDAEKAFDRLDWKFMTATLRYIGLGPRMLRMIEALYSKPSAQIRVNSTISESFPLFNGT